MVIALELSRVWKMTMPAYVPVVIGVSLYEPLPLSEMLP